MFLGFPFNTYCHAYHIRNIQDCQHKNGKFYIGSAVDIHWRWTRHRSTLKHNKHENIHLQRAYNKYGKDVFVYDIIEETQDILQREQYYLDMLKPWDFTIGYNIGKQASGGDNLTHHPKRKEIIEKITNTLRNQISNMTDSEKSMRWSRGVGSSNPNWKGGISICHCIDCGDEISYGNIRCMKCSKVGKQNPFYGKHHTDETKQKVSIKMKGKLPINTNPIILDGVSYVSQADAARKLGVSIGSISNWVRGRFKRRLETLSPDVDHIQST